MIQGIYFVALHVGPCLGPHPESVQVASNSTPVRKAAPQGGEAEDGGKKYKWSVKPGGRFPFFLLIVGMIVLS